MSDSTRKVRELTYDDNDIKELIKGAIAFYNRENNRVDIVRKGIEGLRNDPAKQRKLNDLENYRRSLSHYKDFIQKINSLPFDKAKQYVIIEAKRNRNNPMFIDAKKRLMNIPSDGLVKTFLDNKNLRVPSKYVLPGNPDKNASISARKGVFTTY